MTDIFKKIWLMPLIIGLVTIVGLFFALLGDGVLDVLSWVGLSMPLVILVRVFTRNYSFKK